LAAIVYFQNKHYSVHVYGAEHPTFLPVRENKWFNHDGIKQNYFQGRIHKANLFESEPKLQIDIKKDKLRPYILVYRVASKESSK